MEALGVRSVFRDDVFAGKVALVTGGGSGIGLRTAKELVMLGCDLVFIAARKIERLEDAARSINVLLPSPKVFPIELNIRDSEGINKALDSLLEISHNRLDLLVNNAGGQFPSMAAWIPEKGWKAVIDLNLTGTFLVSQIVFNRVFSEQRSGCIVNVIANMARGFPTMAHTGAARAAVDNLTKTLAVEWASSGVRVNSVAPGTIDSSGLLTYDPSFRAKIMEASKYNYANRMGTEEEVASCIIFLLSPGASYVTGETIYVDAAERFYNPLCQPVEHSNLPAWRDPQAKL
eukprot:TRINITY_DN4095_c0_g1_i2.p1 TRINITY_DN4095_c0_g1~~TRINITY_DN4095_c0_g1_i2.p1  ORF type:complete len:306 (-),score=63.37 TRINITY_DN4095_c0_g1_i2:9-875(-)